MIRRTLAISFILSISAVLFSISLAQHAYHFNGYVYDAVYCNKLNNVSLTISTQLDTLQMATNATGYYGGEFISTRVLLPAVPQAFDLISQNYPNPFNPATTIKYAGSGKLQLFDVTGKLVFQRGLNNDNVTINLQLASGVYFYRFNAPNGVQRTRKMLLLDGSHAELHLVGSANGSAILERNKILTAELPARFVIEKPEYGSIDTVITLVSEQTNRHDFVLRMFNYPPVTSVPKITVDKNGPTNVALSRYVKDPDNLPTEMSWNVTNYDTSLVSIIIEGDTARIINNDMNGSTPVTWIATDPAAATGQNTSQIQINPSYKVTIVLEDPINGSKWGLMPFNLVGENQNTPLISGIDGSVIAYTKSDTGRVIVPISETVWESVQRY